MEDPEELRMSQEQANGGQTIRRATGRGRGDMCIDNGRLTYRRRMPDATRRHPDRRPGPAATQTTACHSCKV